MPAKRLFALLNRLNAAGTVPILFAESLSASDFLGVTGVLIGRGVPGADDSPSIFTCGLPDRFVTLYRDRHYDRFSIVSPALMASKSPVVWHLDKVALNRGEDADEMTREAIAAGLAHGVAVPVWRDAQLSGWVSLVLLEEAARAPDLFSIQLMALTLYNRFDELSLGTAAAAPGPLTQRELQVIELTADGLSSKQIGRRLAISDRTVEFHISRATSKLGASNKTESVAKAIRLGLVSP